MNEEHFNNIFSSLIIVYKCLQENKLTISVQRNKNDGMNEGNMFSIVYSE